MFVSTKDRVNSSTNIFEKNIRAVFMSTNNQIRLSKAIYQMHKSNGGIRNYIYFRTLVPKAMLYWISELAIDTASQTNDIYTIDQLYYINKKFIKTHDNLYTFTTNEPLCTIPDTNVYKISTPIAVCDENNATSVTYKKYGELMASDYGQVDVWQTQTTEVSDDLKRYKNAIPVWQRTMHSRCYDTSNEGYRYSIDASSTGCILRGYDSDFKKIQDDKLALYTKNNTRSDNY